MSRAVSPVLAVRSVVRRYPRPRRHLLRAEPPMVALNDVSLTLSEGETLGVVGESGSGKTTLARLVMGFETPDEGQILLDGTDLAALSPSEYRRLRPEIQMIFQDPFGSLDPRRTAGWSIGQPLRATGQSDAAPLVGRMMERVGLNPADAERYPHEFSGGQRQRIAIARAIITRPRVLVADEAVSALDVSVRAQILNLLMDLQEDFGLAILFITHDMSVVSSLCDSLMVLRQGARVEGGPAQDILTRPKQAYTAMLMNAARMQPHTQEDLTA